MLQTIREHTQGWFAGVIISLIILSFALWGIHSYFVGGPNNIVAMVNGIDISTQELASAYERLRRQIMAQYGANAINSNNQGLVKDQALRGLIDMEVLSQASLDQGFYISDLQIDNYLQTMPDFQVNGVFSIERFQETLAASQLSNNEFLKLIKTSLLIDQPKVGIVFTSFALPEQTDYSIKLINQDRNLAYLKLTFADSQKHANMVASNEIVDYYNVHKNDFMTPEQVKIDYLELNTAELAKKINPSEEELKAYYKENNTSYMSPPAWKLKGILVPFPAKEPTDEQVAQTKVKADEVYQNLQKGERFEKVASKFEKYKFPSSDFLNAKQIAKPLQDTVATVNQANQYLAPVRLENGYLIMGVVDYREGKIEAYELVKAKVHDSYIKMKAEEKFAEEKERLADLTYENPTSLFDAAKELTLPIKKSDYFTLDKPAAEIAQYKKVRNAAFSSDVLTSKNNSDVILINGETAIVLRVNSHVPAALLPLNQVSPQIENKIKALKAEKQTADLANLILEKLRKGESMEALAKEYHVTWQQPGFIGRYSTKVDNAILDMAFKLPNRGEKTTTPYFALTRIPDGYAVIALKAVREGKASDKKQASVFAEQAQSSDGLLEYELYKQSQIAHAKIKIYQ